MAKAITEIRSLARQYTASAMKTLVHIMREPTAPPSARVAAANSLLDRGWGKAEATVIIDDKRDATDWTRDELVTFLSNAAASRKGAAETDGRSGQPDSVH
jgi:hypothetical protein